MDLAILVAAFVLILAGAELFTNGIEWVGHKLQLAEGAVGSVLAAVGTALPETMIPIIAILVAQGDSNNEIGIGAILGAPFMLSTLAMFVSGVAVLAVARRRALGETMLVQPVVLFHDVRWFYIGYAIAIGAAFLPADLVWPRWAIGAGLLVLYALYVREHFRAESDPGGGADALAPLRLHRLDARTRVADGSPRLRIVGLQVAVALGFIIAGALVFVGAVEGLAGDLGVSVAILALIIAPIATELPEKFNSVIWIRQSKDTLAMGNITGAMVFQSMVPTVVALFFAPAMWSVSAAAPIVFASAGIAFLSTAAIFVPMRVRGVLRGRWLLVGGAFYVVYLACVLLGIGTAGVAAG
ncbi:MAG: sodium:calcium antiporter [Chloroflexota bacterium]